MPICHLRSKFFGLKVTYLGFFHEVFLPNGTRMKPFSLRTMMDFQRVNHFPRSYELTRKDRLAKNCERMAQNKSAKMFDFIPRSFMMPSEYQDFCQHAARDKGPWIGSADINIFKWILNI